MNFRNFLAYSLVLSLGLGSLSAKEKPLKNNNKRSALQALAEGCAPATAQTDLNINNVRARILGGGDMWWDLNDAQYEVPKGSNKHSMFAGALWLGGYDDADQLKLAAMTYRQDGVDYWPGPLDDNASITEETCQEYDQHWTVYRSEVETHKAWIECKEDPACDIESRFPGYAGNIPQSIIDWPGNGINGSLPYKLAPYQESDTNGIPGFYEYEWDYPGYDFTREADCQDKDVDLLYGDQTIWWVYNDKGNIHTETNAAALGFEIRAQAFAFTANDEVNNMTFNNYRIINRSTFRLRDTYFGTWFDADLGNPYDDIIGSDIARGLGYVYNGDSDDEGALGYGANPPAVGFDFFQGPFADYFDGIDNDRDGCPDAVLIDGICVSEDPTIGINERIIMSGFMYYNNSSNFSGPSGTTDPNTAQEFYNLLNSLWKDGRSLVIENPSGKGNTANGDGYNVTDPTLEATLFAYPGNSYDTTGAYEPDTDINWFESPNNQADKRGLHCAGPFSLAPGALNFITTGAVWARNFTSQDIFASVNDVIVADDKAQQLFDNCFQVLDGPNAPNVEIVELDRELILNFVDPFNISTIGYVQKDPRIPPNPNWSATQIDSADRADYFNYLFEGFQIFQVANSNVGVDDLYDISQSRLIAQSDLKNGVNQLVNYFESPDLIGNPLLPKDMTLEAKDGGIELSYRVLEDAFAQGNRGLVNHKEYYFYVLSYAQNDYLTFVPGVSGDNSNAQKTPYLAGRRNIGQNSKPYLGIPSKVESRNNGTSLNASWGDLVEITRVAGKGNGSAYLRINSETEEAILAVGASQRVTYSAGFAPVEIKVVDPFAIGDGTYQLRFTDLNTTRSWELIDVDANVVVSVSKQGIDYTAEQIIVDPVTGKSLGFSITISDAISPGLEREGSTNNGVIGGTVSYEDPTKAWLSGVADSDANNPTNWILAGSNNISDDDNLPAYYYNDYSTGDNNVDPLGEFETILGGTWGPVSLASNVPFAGTPGGASAGDQSPGYPLRDGSNFSVMYPIDQLPNINVIISPDPNKWSRVPVLEMGNYPESNEGGVATFRLRSGASLNKAGDQLIPDAISTGWSYFPGYAYNVETGTRLNLVIAENSWLKSENGDDMLWNPTANLTQKLGAFAGGGMHVIYVLADSAIVDNQQLDLSYQGDAIDDYPLKDAMENMSRSKIRSDVWGAMTWCSIGMLSGREFAFTNYTDIPTEVKVEIRVQSPFAQSNDMENDGNPLYEFSMDGFQAVTNSVAVANKALDQIRVVPNPYYGSSGYEDGQLDNVVKITNLPPRCEINIFMPNGTLIRTLNKDNALTYLEWDLKNDFNVPIASGIYLIHIDAGIAGQKVVKWMGSLRPVDLNAF
jgi:hypothetical protein